MKKIIMLASVALMLAAPAMAGGWKPKGGNTYNSGGKGGSATAGASAGAIGVGVGVGVGHGGNGGAGGAGGAGGDAVASSGGNQFTVNGGDYDAAAYAPDVIVGDCQWGVSAGVPGAVAGIGIPGRHCRVLMEAELIEYYWGRDAAAQHLYNNNQRIRQTIEARQAPTQPVRVSTRSAAAPVAKTPRYCRTNDAGQLVVRVPKGASEAVRAERIAACGG